MNNELRRSRLFANMDLSNLSVLEIGPLDRPLVLRNEVATLIYSDHLLTEDLIEKYANDGNVIGKIVEIDFLWSDLVSKQNDSILFSFDLVLASHIIEHVPNLLGWLKCIEKMLKLGGKLLLVIPDKTFTFDFLREVSRVDQVLAADILQLEKPNAFQILDDIFWACDLTIPQAWNGQKIKEPKQIRSLGQCFEIAEKAVSEESYLDVHCWVFTPKSFSELIEYLNKNGIINLKITKLIETQHMEFEFYVELSMCE